MTNVGVRIVSASPDSHVYVGEENEEGVSGRRGVNFRVMQNRRVSKNVNGSLVRNNGILRDKIAYYKII